MCLGRWPGSFLAHHFKEFRIPTFLVGFPGAQMVKNLSIVWGDLGSILGLGRSPGGGHGNPFQYSCLGNPHGQRSLVGYSSILAKGGFGYMPASARSQESCLNFPIHTLTFQKHLAFEDDR